MMHQLHTKRVQIRRIGTLRYCSGLSRECKKGKETHIRSTQSGASVHVWTPLEEHQLAQKPTQKRCCCAGCTCMFYHHQPRGDEKNKKVP